MTATICFFFSFFFLFGSPAAATGREINPLVDLSNAEDLVQLAGYGYEKLSTVLISGALVAVSCHTSGITSKSNWAEVATDEFGDFLIDLPSQFHAIPDLNERCVVKVLRLPENSLCHTAFTGKQPELTLSSSRNSIRTYTAGTIVLTAPNWLADHDIVQFLFCNFDCILFYHMYIAAPVEARCFEMAILAFSRKISSYPLAPTTPLSSTRMIHIWKVTLALLELTSKFAQLSRMGKPLNYRFGTLQDKSESKVVLSESAKYAAGSCGVRSKHLLILQEAFPATKGMMKRHFESVEVVLSAGKITA
ncbi:hypothetical protein Vadar_022747 [Vaccinium darrowii]|uniref:Uncharacterized protein n=1 Tax=Vaccinium darrowii TaxID=229202 RepID=A0ACB7XC09_9ERIC|nr:hypothetical protein Vadar_022747 [Vaccinium darrowii]